MDANEPRNDGKTAASAQDGSPCSTSKSKFTIHSYFPHDKDEPTSPYIDKEEWKRRILGLTNGRVAVIGNEYTTPLKLFKYIAVPDLSKVSKNHCLFHKFVACDLNISADDLSEDLPMAVSFEKGPSGLLFQIAPSLEVVKENRKGCPRLQPVQLFKPSEQGPLGHSLGVTSIEAILDGLETDPSYNVFWSNCQHAVTDWQKVAAEKSSQLMFRMPVTHKYVSLDDSKTLTTVEDLFPAWKNGQTQYLPEKRDPYAIQTSAKVADEDSSCGDYKFLQRKQNVTEAMAEVLKRPDEQWSEGRKAIMSKLNEVKFKKMLQQAATPEKIKGEFMNNHETQPQGDLNASIVEELTTLWSTVLELVVVSDALGVILLAFQRQDEHDDQQKHLCKEMIKLAEKVEDVSIAELKPYHVLNVKVGAGKNEPAIAKPKAHGYWLHMSLRDETMDQPKELQDLLLKALKSISFSLGEKSSQFLHKFTAKLFLLQNMENEQNFTHQRIEKQEYGSEGVCIWTKSQRNILDQVNAAFLKNKQIKWVISGGYGSGKTLLLLQIARDFLKIYEGQGKVYICLPEDRSILSGQLRKKIASMDESCKNRIIVYRIKDCPRKFGKAKLVLFDEIDQWFQPPNVNANQIVFSSSGLKADFDRELLLEDGCLRSTQDITEFVNEFQNYAQENDILGSTWPQTRRCTYPCSLPLKPALRLSFGKPKIILIKDDTKERSAFIDRCSQKIVEISQSDTSEGTLMVSCLANMEMREQLHQKIHGKDKSSRKKSIIFGHPLRISGCQYPGVVMVLQLTASDVVSAQVELIMSRATTSLCIIVDLSEVEVQIRAKENPTKSVVPSTPEKKEAIRKMIKFFAVDAQGCDRESISGKMYDKM